MMSFTLLNHLVTKLRKFAPVAIRLSIDICNNKPLPRSELNR